jgi:hypothetical protein
MTEVYRCVFMHIIGDYRHKRVSKKEWKVQQNFDERNTYRKDFYYVKRF